MALYIDGVEVLSGIIMHGTWTASGTVTLPAFTLGGALNLNSQYFAGAGKFDNTVAFANTTEGRTAAMNIQTKQQAVALSGATTDSTINIPTGSILLGVSFCVNVAVADSTGNDTWSAAYVTGATTSLASGAAPAQNTKVDKLVVPELAGNTTNVQFTPNAGTFTAGTIEIVAYYIDLTSLASV